MVDQLLPPLDAVFHALSDATRRAMIERLSRSVCTVGELAQPFRMSLAAASKHVKVLERAGLVRRRVAGRRHLCTLEPAALRDARQWLAAHEREWNERFDALDRLIAATSSPENPT